MEDKDRRIIVCNIFTNGNVEKFQELSYHLSKYFDDTVKCFFVRTDNPEKQFLEVVSDFPVEGRDAIKSILDSELSLEEKLIAIKELVEIRDGE